MKSDTGGRGVLTMAAIHVTFLVLEKFVASGWYLACRSSEVRT
jgi:hypothetical protein